MHASTLRHIHSDNKVTLDLTLLSCKDNVQEMKKGTAKAIRVQVPGWKCPKCGSTSVATGNRPPRRCVNRATCGVLFHNHHDDKPAVPPRGKPIP